MPRCRLVLMTFAVLLVTAVASAAPLQVVGVSPGRLSTAAATSAVTITFDRAVLPASVTAASFRVFGKQSGVATGPVTFSNANQSVTLTPSRRFAAGENVIVNLSHDVLAADSMPLRSAGYMYQFRIQVGGASRTFTQIQQLSDRTNAGTATRLYGAMAADLNGDGWIDLTAVNEIAADLRVFMNHADGSGTYAAFLQPPEPIGVESSPNESGDFDGDGKVDIAVSSTDNGSVWLVRGAGNGTWTSAQEMPVGMEPHGIAVLDIDGDGDWDFVNANQNSDNLSVMVNNGGVLAAPTFIESGGAGEYALNSGDMNGDGIADLVVGAQNSEQIIVLLGNGNGTFTPQPAQDAGGLVWKLVLGDLDGDGKLDVAAVNGDSNTASILLGNGDGTVRPPTVYPLSGTGVGTVLGDLDGDGDLDWVVSSFSGGRWHVFINDGTGTFTEDPTIAAVSNPSCAILTDVDDDGDLDLVLTDEVADLVKVFRNEGGAPPACPAAPDTCRLPAQSGVAKLQMTDKADDTRDHLAWKWLAGSATTKPEFGDPIHTDGYTVCLYDAGALVKSWGVTGACGTQPCWKDKPTGFAFGNRALLPNGVQALTLKAGVDGAASIIFKGKGVSFGLPAPGGLTGPIDVQLRRSGAPICWGARYSPPFLKDANGVLADKAD